MIIAPRWKKIAEDFVLCQGRLAMMTLAIAMGVFAVAAISTAYCILARELDRQYLATNPAALKSVPVLAHVAGQIGDPQVRHRGTIGGSIAHGDPASDLPAVVLALGGTLVAQGPNGRREIDAKDFFLSFFEVALAPDELLVEVRVPRVPGSQWGFEKLTKRAQDWAIVGAVAVRTSTGVGVGLVNMGPVPLRSAAVESAVASGASAAQAAELAAEGTEPSADFNGSVAYRQHVARVLVRRALERAGV